MKKYRHNWNIADKQYLTEIYPYASKADIEKRFPNMNYHSVVQYAMRMGIRKDKTAPRRNGDLRILLSEDLSSLYWVGFIFADGYIHHKTGQLVLTSAMEDEGHIKKFSEYVNGYYKIYNQKQSGFRRIKGKQVRCSIAHKYIIKSLIKKYNFNKQKTYNPPSIEILKNILNSKEKFLAFFVGFFDGDGNINGNYKPGGRIELHSSWHTVLDYFCEELQKYYPEKHKNSKFSKRGYAVFRIESGIMTKIKSEIHKNRIPYMNRKWSKISFY